MSGLEQRKWMAREERKERDQLLMCLCLILQGEPGDQGMKGEPGMKGADGDPVS